MLDGGTTAKVVGVAVSGFWLCTAFVIVRRRFNPTKFDLVFVRWAFWAMLAIAALRQALA